MKLLKLLNEVLSEIGDATKQPYSYELIAQYNGGKDKYYRFVTDSGTVYEVQIMDSIHNKPGKPKVTNVQFGAIDEYGELDFDIQTGENDIYKVMSTIVKIAKDYNKDHPIDIIQYIPSKREGDKDMDPINNVRTKLYVRYIKTAFPNIQDKDIKRNGTAVTIKIK